MTRQPRAALLAPLLGAALVALAACGDPTGPHPAPDASARAASALRVRPLGGSAVRSSNPVDDAAGRVRPLGGKAGVSSNPVEDATGAIRAQGYSGVRSQNPVEDGARQVSVQRGEDRRQHASRLRRGDPVE